MMEPHRPSVARLPVVGDAERRTIPSVFLGDDLLTYLVMAMGGALCVGNVFAVARPPAQHKEGELARAPVGRSLLMAAIGFLAFAWAAASLVTG